MNRDLSKLFTQILKSLTHLMYAQSIYSYLKRLKFSFKTYLAPISNWASESHCYNGSIQTLCRHYCDPSGHTLILTTQNTMYDCRKHKGGLIKKAFNKYSSIEVKTKGV